MPWSTSQSTYLRSDCSSIDRSLRMGVTIAAIRPFRSGRSMCFSFLAIAWPTALAIAWPTAQRIADGHPDPIGTHRQVDVADTKVGERIDYRVVDRGSGPDGPPFADALRPQGVPVGGGRQRDGDERGEVRRTRHPVGGEAGRQRIAQLVVDDGFEQRLG